MRDINRIPEILNELEKVWKKNPDFRLGQLITVATRPKYPHSATFNIEDDEILEGLKNIGTKQPKTSISEKPFWEKYPDVSRMAPEGLSIELVQEVINVLKEENNKMVITPKKLMWLNCVPVDDASWMKGQKSRVHKLEQLLEKIKDNGVIEEIEIGYRIKPVSNTL